MFEKVNPKHPDKIADRIGGAIVDLGYKRMTNPKIAGECLIGHGNCHIIIETNVDYEYDEIRAIVDRITEDASIRLDLQIVAQDEHLAKNQEEEIRCGDNGIFKGVPTSNEEYVLTKIAAIMYNQFKSDGKYVIKDFFCLLKDTTVTICQSKAKNELLENMMKMTNYDYIINPLGECEGGINVDTGATNRKLGSDMGRAVTGGGLHFKDLSKADVSVNIFCYLESLRTNQEVEATCNIGDAEICLRYGYTMYKSFSYKEIVEKAKKYIDYIGGFEKLAEWGLIRPIDKKQEKW